MGKTAFALNCAARMAERGNSCAFFSLEMSESQLIDRIFAVETNVNSTKFRKGNFNRDNWISINDTAQRGNRWPLYIDDTPGLSYQQLRSKARYLKKAEDIGCIFVDYLQLMDSSSREESRQQEISAISRGLMARPRLMLLDEPSLGLAPILVAQIFEILKRINRDGTTIFLVEQNAHMALNIADRGYVIANGEIKLSGAGKELLSNDEVRRTYLGES